MMECSAFHNETSVNCDINFTTYKTPGCGPYCWKGMWVACSALTSIIWLFVLCVPVANRHIQDMRPATNLRVMHYLVVKPYFWYLNFLVFLVVIYDVIILSQKDQKHVSGSQQVEAGVAVSKLLTVSLIFQLNFTYPPGGNLSPRQLVALSCYYITLLIFVLDYLCKFIELSIRIAYKLYSVNSSASDRELQVFGLMLEVADAVLYKNFTHFFWNKIFRGRSDVLMVYAPDLAQSLGLRLILNSKSPVKISLKISHIFPPLQDVCCGGVILSPPLAK